MKKQKFIALVIAVGMVLSACGNVASNDAVDTVVNEQNSDNAVDVETVDKNDSDVINTSSVIDVNDVFSDRDLSGEYDVSECHNIILADSGSSSDTDGVSVDGGIVTISQEGDYILTGSLSDGMIIVDVDKEEKVQLILNGVNINSASSSAIYVKQADKVFVTLAGESENTLSNGGKFIAIDDNNIDAVIFSKEDLTLNGEGSLTLKSTAGHGVVSKDELTITGGNYDVDVSLHGFSGKDSVSIASGSFDITAGKDGIHSNNDDDDTKGCVYIEGGDFVINAASDGIAALNEIYVADGNIDINKSAEGFEARLINILGGEINIVSSDDGLNATDKRGENENTEDITGQDNMQSDELPENIPEMPNAMTGEKPENMPEIPNVMTGEKPENMPEIPNDINGEKPDNIPEKPNEINGERHKRFEGERPKMPEGGFKGFGGGMMDTDEEANINISGGIINIDAEGDGVDTNGYFTMSGGELYVTGPSNGGNGALDYGIDAIITGGIVVAAGQSSMAVNFGDDSTQCSMLVNTQTSQAAGTDIVLYDNNGDEVIAWTMEKSYNSVVISSPELSVGSTYTVKMGDSTTEVILEDIIYGSGTGMGGFRG